MLSIDLNCDLGEAFGNYTMPDDALLMDYLSSVNIACGFHAGDPAVMHRTVEQALARGLAIGAHPGLPDLQGFGRREMKVSPAEVYRMTLYQVGALHAFTTAANTRLHHVKAHGALYNMAARDISLARAFAQAVHDFDARLIIYGLAGSEMLRAAGELGLAFAAEVFADRTYQPNGLLTPRSEANALITDENESIAQVMSIIRKQEVKATNARLPDGQGQTVPLKGDTLCLHGDGPHALAFARLIHTRLKEENITIKAPSYEKV